MAQGMATGPFQAVGVQFLPKRYPRMKWLIAYKPLGVATRWSCAGFRQSMRLPKASFRVGHADRILLRRESRAVNRPLLE